NTILNSVGKGFLDVILYLIDILIYLFGEIAGVSVFLGSYLISIILLGILSVRYFRKKKFLTSLFFLMVPLLMLAFIIAIIYNTMHKGGF
ncbi:MAG: hypothetical protein V1773_05805, partial [bacterium]